MEKLTAQEARDLAERIIPPVSVVSRIDPPSGDGMLLGISDTVGRALATDTDGVFALIRHTVARTRAQATQLAEDVAIVQRLGPASRAEAPVVVSKVPQLVDLLDQMLVAPDGQLARLHTRFNTLAAQYARSSRTLAGRHTVGMSPQQARADGLAALDRVVKAVPVLLANILLIQSALTSYVGLDLVRASRLRGVAHARDIMQSHAARVTTDQSPAIIDAALISGILQVSSQPDPRVPKYSGSAAVAVEGAGNWTNTRLMTLDGTLSSWSPLRQGDPIFVGTTLIGRVSWVSGVDVRFVAEVGAVPGASTQTITIRSRGHVSYEELSNSLPGLVSAGQAHVRQLPSTLRQTQAYIGSGVATDWSGRVGGLSTWASIIVQTLGGYEASGVSTIEDLLLHLRQERLPLVADALIECRFYALQDIGALLSAPAQLGDLLRAVQDTLVPDGTNVLVRYGRPGTDDYFTTGGE